MGAKLVKVQDGLYRTDSGETVIDRGYLIRLPKGDAERYQLVYRDAINCKVVKRFPTLGAVRAYLGSK